MAQTDDGALDELFDATAIRNRAVAEFENADHEWRKAIREALDRGARVALIADTAGISRERVYQIRDGRR